ncbi:MAG: type IV pilus assembly protein PilC [Bacteroidetes bacterium HLUCCA01]|nr:MAG: type IV pilus assembly protein PilC [Bacteroidetes bacterium HLUCCA01]
MPVFRLKGISPNGKLITNEFEADTRKIAQERVNRFVKSKNIKIQSLDQRANYLYKVEKDGKVLSGEQEAYSKEELERALLKLGYRIKSVQKELISFKGGVPIDEVVNFINISADLLKQKLTFDEILNLLYEDTQNKRMKEIIKTIQKDLKDGKEGNEVYGKHADVFGKFASYMLSVASTSGNMALVFESTAKFMERDATFKKNLRRSLLMPVITVLAVVGVVLFYVGYIFPSTAELFVEMGVDLPPMTEWTLNFSYFLRDTWLLLVAAHVIPIAAFISFIRTEKGKLFLDRFIIMVPVIGDLLHKTSIEIFARVFYTLYSGSGQNVEVIKVASEACRNTYMEKQIKEKAVRGMLQDGKGLMEGLEASGVFTKTALSRFRLGAETGDLKNNARQLAEYYEIQTTYKMNSVIDVINLFINMFIMIALVAITIVSSETAVIQP